MTVLVTGKGLLRWTHDRFLAALTGRSAYDVDLLLRELGRPEALAGYLTELAADDERAGRVAYRSHRHALGFDKFILAAFGELGQLRMHVWWPDQDRRREHIHNHRFAFSSAVVAGNLWCHYYRTMRTGRPVTHFREFSRAEDTGWRFRCVGPAAVTETLTAHLAPGSFYSMPADLLHRIDAESTATVTLMFQKPNCRDWSSVLVGEDERLPERLERSPFDLDELRQKLSWAIRALPE